MIRLHTINRFWPPMSVVRIRDSPMCRYSRSGSASRPIPQPHEHDQSNITSTTQPEIAGTRSKSPRKKTGGCEESVLCRRRILRLLLLPTPPYFGPHSL